MDFSFRFLEEEDYNELLGWWKWFRFPAPAREFLPDNATCGIMVSKGEMNICAGFLYSTNSKLCWIEFIVSNPQYKDKNRKGAIELLIKGLAELAKKNGFKAIFSSIKDENLKKSYKNAGFLETSKNTTEFILSL